MISVGRVPRVSRFEYLTDYLTAVREGLAPNAIEERLAKRKTMFESEKYAALGRGGPFSEAQKRKLMNAREILKECRKLCSSLGLIDETSSTISETGNRLINSQEKDKIQLFMRMLFGVYPIFGMILLALQNAEANELRFPDGRHTSEYRRFREEAGTHGLDLDMITFLAIRDLLCQAGYVNWLTESRSNELWYMVYLTARLAPALDTEGDSVKFAHEGKTYYVESKNVELDIFNHVLWEEYLKRTNDVPLRPVFYAELRTATCSRLHVSDKVFDDSIRRLLSPSSPFNVIWSSGTLPFSREFSTMLKNIPPKSPDGQYMVYLKIGRK